MRKCTGCAGPSVAICDHIVLKDHALLPRVEERVSRNAVVSNLAQLLWLAARPPACSHLLSIRPAEEASTA
ncbi:unnamed protein product [Arctogadus glacialis]